MLNNTEVLLSYHSTYINTALVIQFTCGMLVYLVAGNIGLGILLGLIIGFNIYNYFKLKKGMK